MNIKTKLDLNQEAFFLKGNAVTTLPVAKITAAPSTDVNGKPWPDHNIEYEFRLWDRDRRRCEWLTVPEKEVFASKAELLASL